MSTFGATIATNTSPRLERAVEDVKGELREMRRHHELVITTMQANTELLKAIAKHRAPS